jgi:hypothetical protein
MAGIRRDAPNPQKKRAATLTVLRELLAPIPDDFPGLRDRALLLVGFAGALRRSELAGILRADLARTDQSYELTLKRSKGSQTEAVLVPLPYGKTELCPVRALGGHSLKRGASAPAWPPARTPPSSSASAATRASTCSASIWSSATCSTGIPCATCCSRRRHRRPRRAIDRTDPIDESRDPAGISAVSFAELQDPGTATPWSHAW